jgi:hypothetical protein
VSTQVIYLGKKTQSGALKLTDDNEMPTYLAR